jgi:hypothetical protein
MTIYKGYRHSNGVGGQLVTKDEDLFSPVPSLQVWNHSPDGFNWGYGGSGPSQLALAILFDVTKDRDTAVKFHQDFKRAFVAGWGENWTVTEDEVINWLRIQVNKEVGNE